MFLILGQGRFKCHSQHFGGLCLGRETGFNRWASENDLRSFPSCESDLVDPGATDDPEKRLPVLPLNS